MLQWLVLALSVLFQASATLPDAYDVATLKIGAPISIVELDTGRLKGDFREISWSPDLTEFYIQTMEGNPKSLKLRDGRLTLPDQRKHKHGVSGAKDAPFPAWTLDGTRLAWVQRNGRKSTR